MTRKILATLGIISIALALGKPQYPADPDEKPRDTTPRMTASLLEKAIREAATDFGIEGNVMEFTFERVAMACIYDPVHDRMRIVAPIEKMSDVTPEQVSIAFEANFHTALDGRYATSNGVLYAAYIHPLSMLRVREVQSALRQVASLVTTFGTSYTSGELIYGGNADDSDGPDA